MKGYEYQSDFAKKYVAEGLTKGIAKGRAEEAVRNLLTVLRVRGLAVPDALRERILAQKDPERLERSAGWRRPSWPLRSPQSSTSRTEAPHPPPSAQNLPHRRRQQTRLDLLKLVTNRPFFLEIRVEHPQNGGNSGLLAFEPSK